MLRALRKFSTTILAKILFGIVVIPLVLWGMGTTFTGGNKNIVLMIEKEKYSIQEFTDFVRKFAPITQKVTSNQIDELLSLFISEKIIEIEVERLGIKFSDNSLGNLIKNQKDFKREKIFSRIEYEKFLLENNMTAFSFEADLAKREKKNQLLNYIGGGVVPAKFLVNNSYDKINQKRKIQIIDLNPSFEKEFNFSEEQIEIFFQNNKDKFTEIYKSAKILELNPKKLVGNNEFNDLFFKKIDEIDDMLVQGENLESITQKYNLEKSNIFTFNKLGKDINSKIINEIPKNLIENFFSLDDAEPTILIENKDKYFVVELIKTENIEKKIEDKSVKKTILLNLENNIKKKLISEIISKVNKNNFDKMDFYKLSKDKNLPIKKVTLKNQNDNEILKKELTNQIYGFSEKKVIIVHDLNLAENFLIYIDKIEHVTVAEKSEEYKKYINLSKTEIRNELFNTYDIYIREKYKVDVNYKTLNVVKNYFN